MKPDDPRLQLARDKRFEDFMGDLDMPGLTRSGPEWTGPCPACGGRDRFSINTAKGVWLCRKCAPTGGDGIALVRHVLACDLDAAVTWMVGEAAITISPEEQAARDRKRAADAARNAREAERRRAEAIAQARRIWDEGVPAAGTDVSAYLIRRGLPRVIADHPPGCLRFHPDLPFMVTGTDRDWVEVHRGPAMLAAMQAPSGEMTAVHRTWIDLGRPKGKAVLTHQGETLPAKKMWGSKKGTAIRLTHPLARDFTTLVMGEGIETTLTALAAGREPGAAFWAGGDLGNMAGRALRGPGLKWAGHPDLEDGEAFLPPPWVTRLIFIQDGDSDPKDTRHKLMCGLRRAKVRRPDLWIGIVTAPEGRDLNDVLMAEGIEG